MFDGFQNVIFYRGQVFFDVSGNRFINIGNPELLRAEVFILCTLPGSGRAVTVAEFFCSFLLTSAFGCLFFSFRRVFCAVSGILFGVDGHLRIALLDGRCDRPYISDRQKALHVIDHDEEHHVFAAVLLFNRGNEDFVLDVVVDHGFGQELIVVGVPGNAAQAVLQKGRHLIHVEVDAGNIGSMDMRKGTENIFQFPAHVFGLQVHMTQFLSLAAVYYFAVPFSLAALSFISRAFSRAAGVISPAPRSLASSRSLSLGESLVMWVAVESSPASFSIR